LSGELDLPFPVDASSAESTKALVTLSSSGPRLKLALHRRLVYARQVRELSARANAEFVEHVAEVPFDGPWADEELGADLRVRLPVARKSGNL
jgi:hypothetical protein